MQFLHTAPFILLLFLLFFYERHLIVQSSMELVAMFEFHSAVNVQGKFKLTLVPNDLLMQP